MIDKQSLPKVDDDSALLKQTATGTGRTRSEQDAVMHFLKDSCGVHDLEGLADLVMATVAALDLQAVALLKTPFGSLMKRSAGAPTPIEERLLVSLNQGDKFVRVNKRAIFNGHYTKLLLLEMPPDEAVFRRLRELLGFIVDGCDARCEGLMLHNQLRVSHDLLADIVHSSRSSLRRLSADQLRFRDTLSDSLEDYQDRIDHSFSCMGLSEDQEEKVMAVLSELTDKVQLIMDVQCMSEVFMNHLVGELDCAVKQIELTEQA